jgi:hypothetical protein
MRASGLIRSPDPPHRPHLLNALSVDPGPRPLRPWQAGHRPLGQNRVRTSTSTRAAARTAAISSGAAISGRPGDDAARMSPEAFLRVRVARAREGWHHLHHFRRSAGM